MEEKAILTFFSFNEIFEKEIKKGKKYSQAYEDAEHYHEEKYGQRRYSSYNSFRISRQKKIRKKIN